MAKIKTKDAHDALTQLLEKLDKHDLSKLKSRVNEFDTPLNWVERLRTAQTTLLEWCPEPDGGDNQFTIDVPPKER
jgi:hypothetical protein